MIKLGRMRKKTVAACLGKSHVSPEGTEANHEKLQDSRPLGRESNRGPSEAGVLPITP
jgi:hypothetical protein